MTFLHDNVLDNGIQYLLTYAENLYICSTEPTTFAEASSTYKLGVKTGVTITGPADATSGRKVTVSSFTDGSVTATGTAAFIAITDDSASLLLATQALASTKSVTSGDNFSLTSFDITIPDAA